MQNPATNDFQKKKKVHVQKILASNFPFWFIKPTASFPERYVR